MDFLGQRPGRVTPSGADLFQARASQHRGTKALALAAECGGAVPYTRNTRARGATAAQWTFNPLVEGSNPSGPTLAKHSGRPAQAGTPGQKKAETQRAGALPTGGPLLC